MAGEFPNFEHRAMTEVVRRFPRPNFLGLGLLRSSPVASKTANWDIVEGTRRLGKFVARGAEAHTNRMKARKRIATELLVIKEKKTIDEQTELFLSRPGTFDQPYGEQLLTDELEDLDRIVENTREWARWEAFVKGQLDIRQADPPIYLKVDYGFSATHKVTLTGTNRWSQTADAKPLNDILQGKKVVSRDSWVTPNDAYLNAQGMIDIVQNTQIQTLLQYTVGNQLAANGFVTVLAGIRLHQYDISYLDDAAVVKQFIPDDKFVIIAQEGLGKEFVGPMKVPVGNEESETVIGKVSYSWVTKDPVDRWILVGVAFVPAIQNPDQIYVLTTR